MYSADWGVEFLEMPVKPSDQMCPLRLLFLVVFCLDNLPIDVNSVLKSPTIIVLLSISLFIYVNICFMN